MCADDSSHEGFEETVRSIAREVSRSIERVAQGDLDEVAETIGVDPVRARELVDSAVGWLRAQAEGLGNDRAFWGAGAAGAAAGEVTLVGRHALSRWLDAANPR